MWSRVSAGSATDVVPLACSPARSTADFTWALGTAGSWSMAWSGAPWMVSGARPSIASMCAPIRSSGSMTRLMGRPESDASPTSVLTKA